MADMGAEYNFYWETKRFLEEEELDRYNIILSVSLSVIQLNCSLDEQIKSEHYFFLLTICLYIL